MLSIPALTLAMVASAFLELTTLRLVLILGLVSWPTVARLVRAQVLNEAQLYYLEAPWLAVFPGLAITLAVAAINFMGDGLREATSGRTGEA